MSFKVLAKIIVFLLVLFVMLYIGIYNRQSADFYFPLVLDKKLTTDAALIYFCMFAVGVFTGMILTVGSGSGGGSKRSSSKSEK
jgi:hypothetical protein